MSANPNDEQDESIEKVVGQEKLETVPIIVGAVATKVSVDLFASFVISFDLVFPSFLYRDLFKAFVRVT